MTTSPSGGTTAAQASRPHSDSVLHPVDISIIAFSVLLAIGVGFWSGRRQERAKPKAAGIADEDGDDHDDAVENYFLSSRSMPWQLVGASLFASNIGAEHFVGMAGTAAYDGVAVALHEWLPILMILLLAYVFYPVYCVSGVGLRNEGEADEATGSTDLVRERERNDINAGINQKKIKSSFGASTTTPRTSTSTAGSSATSPSSSRPRSKMVLYEMREIEMTEVVGAPRTSAPPPSSARVPSLVSEKDSAMGGRGRSDHTKAQAEAETAEPEATAPARPRRRRKSSNVPARGPIATMGEYLEGRFDGRLRRGLAVLCLITYVTTKSAMTVYAGALLFQVFFPFGGGASGGEDTSSSTEEYSVYFYSIVLILLTSLYTILGGLTAVMIVDAVQLVIFFFGGILGLAVALGRVEAIGGLRQNLPEHFLHIYQKRTEGPYAPPAPFFGIVVVSLYYWCFDQFMVQRMLAAKSQSHAQKGALLAGALKIFSPFLICFPGMVARALYEHECSMLAEGGSGATAGSSAEESVWCHPSAPNLSQPDGANKAYLLLVAREFPVGVKGVIISSMLAAMLSSLSSIYNSAGSLFTIDIYQHFAFAGTSRAGGSAATTSEGTSEDSETTTESLSNSRSRKERSVRAGKIWQAVMTLLTLLMLPVVRNADTSFYVYAQEIMGHLMPPLVALFLCGLCTTFVNEQGALIGLVLGSACGMVRFFTRSIVLLLAGGGGDVCKGRRAAVEQVGGEEMENSNIGENANVTTMPSDGDAAAGGPSSVVDLSDSWWVCDSFFWFSTELFFFSLLAMIIASSFYDKPAPEKIRGRTVFTTMFQEIAEPPPLRRLSSKFCATPAGNRRRKSGYSNFEEEEDVEIPNAANENDRVESRTGEEHVAVADNVDDNILAVSANVLGREQVGDGGKANPDEVDGFPNVDGHQDGGGGGTSTQRYAVLLVAVVTSIIVYFW